jgi:hypothetical protein
MLMTLTFFTGRLNRANFGYLSHAEYPLESIRSTRTFEKTLAFTIALVCGDRCLWRLTMKKLKFYANF